MCWVLQPERHFHHGVSRAEVSRSTKVWDAITWLHQMFSVTRAGGNTDTFLQVLALLSSEAVIRRARHFWLHQVAAYYGTNLGCLTKNVWSLGSPNRGSWDINFVRGLEIKVNVVPQKWVGSEAGLLWREQGMPCPLTHIVPPHTYVSFLLLVASRITKPL